MSQRMHTCECGCGETPPPYARTNSARGDVKGQPRRFCHGHQSRKSPIEYVIDIGSDCWEWQRAKTPAGYGYVRGTVAHRDYYESHIGPIPAGYVIDHLCRNPGCVNPGHLEAVTNAENVRRGDKTKLTAEQVRAIKAAPAGTRALAASFGIARATMQGIRAGRRWKDV